MTTTNPILPPRPVGLSNADSELPSLIQLINDSIAGLDTAADHVRKDSPQHAAMFAQIATDRRQLAGELNALLASLENRTEQGGTFLGRLHRNWLALRESLSGDSKRNVLAEAVRGEHELRDAFQKALERTAATPMHEVLSAAYEHVMVGVHRIESAYNTAESQAQNG